MTKKTASAALRPPSPKQQDRATSGKIAKALEIRKTSSESRQGKALGFPTHSIRP